MFTYDFWSILPFTGKFETSLDAYLQKNAESRKKMKDSNKSKSIHEYHPEDYGLSAELISSKFKDYIAKYNL